MKRTNLVILTLLAAVLAFVSCEEDITTSKVVVDTAKVASLKVYVYAELDTLSDNDTLATSFVELVPDGTQFIVSVENSDLNPDGNATGLWTSTVTTTNGIFELDVPTTDDGVTVRIDAIAFQHTFKGETETEERVYELINSTVGDVYPATNRVERRTMTFRTISSRLVP